MEIDTRREGSVIHVTITGEIKITDAARLGEAFHEITLMNDFTHVVINMSNVDDISSSGIGKLLNLYKQLLDSRRTMEIYGISELLYDKFLDTHLDRIFPVRRIPEEDLQ